MTDSQKDDLPTALIQTIERSVQSTPHVVRARLWATLDKFGLDAKKLIEQVRTDIKTERRKGKGRQKRTAYNEPPAAIRQRFEEVHAETVVPGTKRGAPAMIRYDLQGPLQRYKTDFAQRELEAWTNAVENGLAAARQNVTSKYGDGVGGGRKIAGGVIDRQRLAYTTHQQTLSQMPREWWPVFTMLIENGITLKAIGKWLLPSVTDERVLRGAGRGALKMMAMQLVDTETKRRGLERGERPDRNMINQIRAERAERRMERT